MRKGRLEDKRLSLRLMLMYKIVESRCLLYKKGQTTSYQEFGTSDILGNCVRNNSRSPRFDKRQHKLTIKKRFSNYNHQLEPPDRKGRESHVVEAFRTTIAEPSTDPNIAALWKRIGAFTEFVNVYNIMASYLYKYIYLTKYGF